MKHTPTIPKKYLLLFGEMIAVARKTRHWRQADLAKRIGVARQTIARAEKGDPNVAAGVYFIAAWILNLPLIPSIESNKIESEEMITQFVQFLKKQLPKRITPKKGQTINDNF